MQIFKYKDYEHYVKEQTFYNKEKIAWSFFNKQGPRKGILILMIEKYFGESANNKDVICHGTRGGHEQQFFKGLFPKGHIQGTEISDTASQFPMTVEWDFTKQHPRWVNRFDIVYSNSFDHSINPQETLRVWHEQLREGGFMFIEWAEGDSVCTLNDPLDASAKEITKLIKKTGFVIEEQHVIGVSQGNMYICRKV